MEVFKVHNVTDKKILLKDDKQLETLFKEIGKDQDFIVEWVEDNRKKTKLFLADGLLSRLKDGSLILESSKKLEKDHPEYKKGEEGYNCNPNRILEEEGENNESNN